MADKPKPPPRPRRTEPFDPALNPEFSNIPAEAEQPNASERFFHVGWEVVKTVAFIVLAAFIIRLYIVQPFFVQGQSMEPTFQDGDYLLVNQLSYRFGTPKRGDVIVFDAPPEPGTNYIKRIIGLPGETVELKNNQLVVTRPGQPPQTVNEPYIGPGLATLPESEETRWELDDDPDNSRDQYFVSGDNREPGKSADSRAWGPVPRKSIIGKSALRVYPVASFGGVKHAEYPNLAFWLR